MGGVAQHMYVHKLCNVAVSVCSVLVFESISQGSAFLGDDSPLLGCGFALPHSPDQLPANLVEFSLIDHPRADFWSIASNSVACSLPEPRTHDAPLAEVGCAALLR